MIEAKYQEISSKILIFGNWREVKRLKKLKNINLSFRLYKSYLREASVYAIDFVQLTAVLSFNS